ncbi:hypothetical protein BGW37DRAFT_430971 [Umbelopsis sp. PMI_123]|nr:hypothetical protein BGW37DRAFT_430971 [Umbelopsis sp. PMI_123]
MGKVTYAIGFKDELPFQSEIKQNKRLYAQYREDGNNLLVADTARQIADILLDQYDELITTSEDTQVVLKSLENALKYCDEATYIFEKFDKLKDIVRYLLYLHVHFLMKNFYGALGICRELESLVLNHLAEDDDVRQEFYKNFADIYFNKGADENQSKCDDFQYAKQYYEVEQRIIQKLTDGNTYVDQEKLQDITRANTFNLGVIEGKIGGDLFRAENLLKKAIDDARRLSDLHSERNGWWELGNLYRQQNNFKIALDCQLNELKLAQLDDLQETELLCLYDIGINLAYDSIAFVSLVLI